MMHTLCSSDGSEYRLACFTFSLASRSHELLQDENLSLASVILLYLNGFEGSFVSYSYIFVLNLSENNEQENGVHT